eukprot:GHVN01028454.1.p1 GENE.GHVN01028454.1~~GHVN01028454.1.p1  ORF type:complete len:228 (-),score=85.62 GHVN01028454.1:33-716(-)
MSELSEMREEVSEMSDLSSVGGVIRVRVKLKEKHERVKIEGKDDRGAVSCRAERGEINERGHRGERGERGERRERAESGKINEERTKTNSRDRTSLTQDRTSLTKDRTSLTKDRTSRTKDRTSLTQDGPASKHTSLNITYKGELEGEQCGDCEEGGDNICCSSLKCAPSPPSFPWSHQPSDSSNLTQSPQLIQLVSSSRELGGRKTKSRITQISEWLSTPNQNSVTR